jgi:hypothetical protein
MAALKTWPQCEYQLLNLSGEMTLTGMMQDITISQIG